MKLAAKFIIFTVVLTSLIACNGDNPKDESSNKTVEEKNNNLSLEERAKREVEVKLSIPVNEDYSIKIYKEHLNGDEKIDAIITVNRLNFAMEEAAKSENPAKRAELGYMGNHNYFFYYDGALDKISVPMVIASSSKAELGIKFENIQSEIYKDVTVEYAIRNSRFRNYYLIENGSLLMTFQWKIFDQVGLENYEANYISYEPGTLSLAKDILISKGKIKNYSTNIPNVYQYNPTIEKNGELLYRFFYDPKSAKYMTKNL